MTDPLDSYTAAEKKAIAAHPYLPQSVAAIFAHEFDDLEPPPIDLPTTVIQCPIEKACDDYWAGAICAVDLINILGEHGVPEPIIKLLGHMHDEILESRRARNG